MNLAQPASAVSNEFGGRLPGLDALRTIAASAVLLSHLIAVALVSASPPLLDDESLDTVSALAHALGVWGVGIFFVLSGLCIHLPMARRLALDGGAQLPVREFLRRRFTRIYPPHLVVLIASIAAAALLPDLPPEATLLTVPTVPQFIAHLFLVHSFGPDAISSGNAVLWTVAVESHFYLLYPLILLWQKRWPLIRITAILFALSVALCFATLHWAPAYVWLVGSNVGARLWQWTLGCWLAERLVARGETPRRSHALWLSLSLLSLFVGAAALLDDRTTDALPWIWPLLAAPIVAAAARTRMTRTSRIDRFLLAIGERSYSLYLTHPIALFCVAGLLVNSNVAPAAQAGLELTSAGLLCAIFFRWIERPFLLASKKI